MIAVRCVQGRVHPTTGSGVRTHLLFGPNIRGQLDLAEHGRAELVLLRRGTRPVVPAAEVAEPLRAPFELLRAAVLQLRLVVQLGIERLGGAYMPLPQQVQVALDRAPLLLQQGSVGQLVAFRAVAGPLDLQQEAEVDRVLAGFGQLKAVFPFDGIEATGRARIGLPLSSCLALSFWAVSDKQAPTFG